MKGSFTLASLSALAIVFVIAAVSISIGADIQDSIAEQICEDNSSNTWGLFDDALTTTTYPPSGTTIGCCDYVNTTNSDHCVTWYSEEIGVNITMQGTDGLSTMGGWLPTIAIVIMAAVVIGILLTSFKFGRG